MPDGQRAGVGTKGEDEEELATGGSTTLDVDLLCLDGGGGDAGVLMDLL